MSCGWFQLLSLSLVFVFSCFSVLKIHSPLEIKGYSLLFSYLLKPCILQLPESWAKHPINYTIIWSKTCSSSNSLNELLLDFTFIFDNRKASCKLSRWSFMYSLNHKTHSLLCKRSPPKFFLNTSKKIHNMTAIFLLAKFNKLCFCSGEWFIHWLRNKSKYSSPFCLGYVNRCHILFAIFMGVHGCHYNRVTISSSSIHPKWGFILLAVLWVENFSLVVWFKLIIPWSVSLCWTCITSQIRFTLQTIYCS